MRVDPAGERPLVLQVWASLEYVRYSGTLPGNTDFRRRVSARPALPTCTDLSPLSRGIEPCLTRLANEAAAV